MGKKAIIEKEGSENSMTGHWPVDHIPLRCFILAYHPRRLTIV
jgi:hypothetical protein